MLLGKRNEQQAVITARRVREDNPQYRQMPVIDEPQNLAHDTDECNQRITFMSMNYHTFPQLAMHYMNRAGWESTDFARETLYDDTTYRLIRGYWLGSLIKPHVWSPQLCLGLIAGLRLPKDEAITLFATATHIYSRSAEKDSVIYEYLLSNYIGRPIAQWNMFLKLHNMKQIGCSK